VSVTDHELEGTMDPVIRSRIRPLRSALAISSMLLLTLASAVSAGLPIAHRVSAGGPDSCDAFGAKPGCDADFSFTATVATDGSVSGQYTDRFARSEGFHGVIDCVVVVGNEAWVSGTITQGRGFDGVDLAGVSFSTRVRDNGSSATQPPDEISNSHVGSDVSCLEQADFTLRPTSQGQVVVQ
jgi:hypothetical protein